ncbi:MAG: HAD family hydrolase [Bacteroidaceae bacterium]|nr:HAD family hydrolase [Bacteroidaceae bacterium]
MKLLILDFDGTLADSRRLIVSTMQETLMRLGQPVPSESECAATIGLPLPKCFVRLTKGNHALADVCAKLYTDELFPKNNVPGAVVPFPNVETTLRLLHAAGFLLTIASSRKSQSVRHLLSNMGLLDLFQAIVSPAEVENAKPAPDMVMKILSDLHIAAADALVVGDTAYDILMGRDAGVRTCGVTYGNGSLQELQDAGAHFIIDDFQQLELLL